MTVPTEIIDQAPERPPEAGPRKRRVISVTLYERVSSFLIAMMVVVFVVLFAAVTFWLSHRPPLEAELVPLELIDLGDESNFGGSLDGVVGGTADVDTGMEGGGEGGETAEGESRPVEFALAAVTANAGTVAQQAMAADLDTGSSSSTGAGSGGGGGTGTGGGRAPLGFGPGKGGGVSRENRWFVTFAGDNSIDEYARQLDAFGIELGVLQAGKELVYLSGVSKGSPTKRVATSGKDEKRLFFTWQGGERRGADVELFQRAGVTIGKGTIYHFYPKTLEDILATVEFNYAKRKPIEIRRTYFVVVKEGARYGFKVTRQTYLK